LRLYSEPAGEFNGKLKRLSDDAAYNLGISEQMCHAFEMRYQRPFLISQNCIEISEWENIEKDYDVGDEFRIVYLGTVTEDKELASLINLRDVVLSLREQSFPVRFVIYRPDLYKATVEQNLVRPPATVYGGHFPVADKQRILIEADLLVLPVNFDQKSQLFTGYSFQTKVPEYMASGIPTLVYGPDSNPNVHYAREEGWGAVVDRRDKQFLMETIVRLMSDRDLRKGLGERARELAFRRHNAEVVQQEFKTLIIRAARKSIK
jgi:glycosyltransferase involved in cell wall biosynthesis